MQSIERGKANLFIEVIEDIVEIVLAMRSMKIGITFSKNKRKDHFFVKKSNIVKPQNRQRIHLRKGVNRNRRCCATEERLQIGALPPFILHSSSQKPVFT